MVALVSTLEAHGHSRSSYRKAAVWPMVPAVRLYRPPDPNVCISATAFAAVQPRSVALRNRSWREHREIDVYAVAARSIVDISNKLRVGPPSASTARAAASVTGSTIPRRS